MIEEVNDWDALCNIFILVMESLSRLTGMSYGLVNILIFVILGPFTTLIFILTTILSWSIKDEKTKRRIVVPLICLGGFIILLILGALFYAFLLSE